MGACVAPMSPRKRRAFNSKFCPSDIKLAHIFCEKAEQNIFFCCFFPAPQGAIWDATSHVAGGVGRAAPQIEAPTSKKPLYRFLNVIGFAS